jgi:hypothetical protein
VIDISKKRRGKWRAEINVEKGSTEAVSHKKACIKEDSEVPVKESTVEVSFDWLVLL